MLTLIGISVLFVGLSYVILIAICVAVKPSPDTSAHLMKSDMQLFASDPDLKMSVERGVLLSGVYLISTELTKSLILGPRTEIFPIMD
jgi:hypothetical protein